MVRKTLGLKEIGPREATQGELQGELHNALQRRSKPMATQPQATCADDLVKFGWLLKYARTGLQADRA